MGEPSMALVPVAVAERPHLEAVARPRMRQLSNLSDGWVLFCPIAGAVAGSAIREFGLYGAAASVAGGLAVAAWVSVVPDRVRRRVRLRSAQFAVRSRLALPPGGSS
jgi:hypothetical protein